MSAAPLIQVDDAAAVQAAPCVLVIGNFDGVHRGHQAVLAEAVAHAHGTAVDATGKRACACALTFDPHPAQIVGSGAPSLLTTVDDRARLMGELGVDRVYVRTFDPEFAAWTPERFASELVAKMLLAKVVVVGQNFRFGSKRAGDLALLQALGSRLGFSVRVHAVASDARGAYSSTRARDAVAEGEMAEACRVLGRLHSVTGTVVRGDERGRTLGFPTANLERIAELLPKDGVYVVRVEDTREEAAASATKRWTGVANLGVRPTVALRPLPSAVRPTVGGVGRHTVEVHVLDYSGNLYDARLRVHFVERLRDEKRFASVDELRAQIAADVAQARRMLAP
jgi:riboflavin kinase/FMN adenylyltransferase